MELDMLCECMAGQSQDLLLLAVRQDLVPSGQSETEGHDFVTFQKCSQVALLPQLGPVAHRLHCVDAIPGFLDSFLMESVTGFHNGSGAEDQGSSGTEITWRRQKIHVLREKL